MGCQPRLKPGRMEAAGLDVRVARECLMQRLGRRQPLDGQFAKGAVETPDRG